MTLKSKYSPLTTTAIVVGNRTIKTLYWNYPILRDEEEEDDMACEPTLPLQTPFAVTTERR